jgi:CDP-glucose 4,6-dehydratase
VDKVAEKAAIHRDFWQQQRVLVTGHTGFIGSWLIKTLDELQCQIAGFALPANTSPALHQHLKFSARVQQVFADLSDYQQLHDLISAFKPSVILHLAAEALVRRAHHHPAATFQSNVMGTINLLEAAKANGFTGPLVVFTTDKVYANEDFNQPFEEGDALGSTGIYDASKACTEILTRAYSKNILPETPIATVRAGNVIGGGDWNEDRLIPDAVRASQQQKALLLRMPSAVRPWQHVLESIYATLLLTEKLSEKDRYQGAWNIGPELSDQQTVREVVQQLYQYMPGTVDCDQSNNLVPEANYLRLDTQKARNQLGWQPLLNFQAAIAMSADWFNAFYQQQDIDSFTREQIQQTLPIV